MFQVTLDPCLLNSIGGATTPVDLQLAISLTGVYWDTCPVPAPPAPADPFGCLPPEWVTSIFDPLDPTVKGMRNVLYPWNWDYPEKIRLYWYQPSGSQYKLMRNAADNSVLFTEVALGAMGGASYAADTLRLTDFYSEVCDNRLWSVPAGGDGKRHFNPYEILWLAGNRNTTISGNPGSDPNTGFLRTTIAHFAQKVAPLNQYLKLVFLEKGNLTPPGGATHFAAFPVGGKWWNPDPAAVLQDPTDAFLSLTYKPVSVAGFSFAASCTLTPLKYAPSASDAPISLRDQNGNFLGNVSLKVSDAKDWGPAVVSDLGCYFALPELLLNYLTANKASLQANGITPPSALGMVQALSTFLWATIRDGLGFGYRPESDHISMVDRVARQYANDGFTKPLEQLSEADQDKYWGRFGQNRGQLYPLFPQADGVHFPDVTTWKGLVAGLDDPTIKALLPGLDPKSLPATSGATGNAVAARIDLDGWLRNWTAFVNLLKDNSTLKDKVGVQVKLMATQWDALGQVDGNEAWYEKVFSAAGDLRSLQLEAISEQYKSLFLQSTGASGSNADATVMAKDAVTAIQTYANARIDPHGGFFPVVTDPFVLPPAELTTPPDWKGLLASVDSRAIEAAIKKEITRTYPTPPPLAITVDVLDTPPQQQTPGVDDPDVQSEIAGHVLLMQRGDGLGITTYARPWRHLNWVNLQTKMAAGTSLFANSYVISAYLPEKNGRKQSALELTNEKLSLIAGHDAYDDSGSGGTNPVDSMQYLFDPHVDPTNGRPDHVGYALWYGYNYRFASFVALNSGVLPQAIRGADWNLPDPAPGLNNHLPLSTYLYLRRVRVSTVRVETLRMVAGPGGQPQAMPVIQPPAGLQPLAFELPGWKDNTVVHYLLTDASLASSAYIQNQLSLRLRKPTTPFWNWYAWLGDDANSIVPGMSVSYAQKALEQDLILRDSNSVKDPNFDGKGHLCDPAADNTFVIVVQEVFPTYSKPTGYDVTLNGVTLLNDPFATFNVKLGTNFNGDWDFAVAGDVATLRVKAGITVSVKIYPTVNSALFMGSANANNPKFYSWMLAAMQASDVDGDVQNAHLNRVFLNPVALLFEAALPPVMDPKVLWDALWIDAQTDSVNLHLKKNKDNYVPLAYFSLLEVRHQVWNWNGRLDNSGDLLTRSAVLDPTDGKTSAAMEWEAWAFSDRPDVSALVQDTNLLAFSPFDPGTPIASIDQVLFTDTRPKEDKALYYRCNATAHSRYELLGDHYAKTVFGCVRIDNADNGWRRYIRKCSRTVKLPKPTIRFILPLTKTIGECTVEGEMATASLLVVLNDRWFTEGGLAEQLELGVDIVADPRTGMNNSYLQAGPDPILSGKGLTAVVDASRATASFPVKGPAGLTFDFAAQTPALTSSAFIVPLPDLSDVLVVPDGQEGMTTQPGPWSLMQVAVRRTLNDKLCETGIAVEPVFSEWSSKEWVQFVPATDSFIPKSWREAIRRNNYLQVNVLGGKKLTVPAGYDLPEFDTQRMQFFLVVTQKVYDVGGQPVEQYLATFGYDPRGGGFTLDSATDTPWDGSGTEGYLRLMLVRSAGTPQPGDSIWKRLFGNNADQQPDPTLVVDDPTAALPLVSERIPFKSIKL